MKTADDLSRFVIFAGLVVFVAERRPWAVTGDLHGS